MELAIFARGEGPLEHTVWPLQVRIGQWVTAFRWKSPLITSGMPLFLGVFEMCQGTAGDGHGVLICVCDTVGWGWVAATQLGWRHSRHRAAIQHP